MSVATLDRSPDVSDETAPVGKDTDPRPHLVVEPKTPE